MYIIVIMYSKKFYWKIKGGEEKETKDFYD